MPKGGRGGSGGRYNGGGLSPNDIVSTRDMMGARNDADLGKHVDDALNVFRDMHKKYGVAVNEIQIAQLKGKAKKNVLGYYDGKNVAMNEQYFNGKVEAVYDKTVASGYHPSKGNKTAIQAVMAHEAGHFVNGEIAKKMGVSLDTAATHIVNTARKQTGDKGNIKMASKISKYATTSNAETIAEAYSDVYCNGRKAKSESKAIIKVVNSYFKKRRK